MATPDIIIIIYYIIIIIIIIFKPSVHIIPREIKKLKSKYKIGYDHQSVLSVASKLSCKRTALKRCTKIEILWYRKLVSWASPVFSEILLPRSSRRWQADALKTPKVSTAIGSKLVEVLLLFASGCHLCCCSCLKSRSVNVWLSQWARDSHVPA